MLIQLETPVVIPAIQEKVYNEKFFRRFEIKCTPDTGNLYFEWVPKAEGSSELLNQPTTYNYSLWELVENIPQAAFALQKVLEALPLIENYIISARTPTTEEENSGQPE